MIVRDRLRKWARGRNRGCGELVGRGELGGESQFGLSGERRDGVEGKGERGVGIE